MQNQGQKIENSLWNISFDRQSGRISIVRHDHTAPSIANALVGLSYANPGGKRVLTGFAGGKVTGSDEPLEDVHGKGRQYRFTSTARPDGLELNYTVNLYDNRPFILLRMEVANRGSGNINLQDINLLQVEAAGGASINFEGRGPLDFFKVGWHDWAYSGLRHGSEKDVNSLPIMKPFIGKMLYNPALPIAGGRGEFWGEGWGLLTDRRTAILAGFASTADQFGVNACSSSTLSST